MIHYLQETAVGVFPTSLCCRFVDLMPKGASHNGAHFFQGTDLTEGYSLHQNISHRRAASVGPALHSRPVALAAHWLSRRFLVPPPMMCTGARCLPVASSICSSAKRYFKAMLSRITRTVSPFVLGTRSPFLRKTCGFFPAYSPA